MYLGFTIVARNLETERMQQEKQESVKKRNVTPESIGLGSIKAQADIRNDILMLSFFI